MKNYNLLLHFCPGEVSLPHYRWKDIKAKLPPELLARAAKHLEEVDSAMHQPYSNVMTETLLQRVQRIVSARFLHVTPLDQNGRIEILNFKTKRALHIFKDKEGICLVTLTKMDRIEQFDPSDDDIAKKIQSLS